MPPFAAQTYTTKFCESPENKKFYFVVILLPFSIVSCNSIILLGYHKHHIQNHRL